METSFGHWIRRRRKALDLTQNELAQRVGCSASLIFKIETDERRPSRQIAELLAQHLDIPAGQRELFLRVARQEVAVLRMEEPAVMEQSRPLAEGQVPPLAISQPMLGDSKSRPSVLPVFPTSFIGREFEIDIVLQQILDPACRLLTLTGPGGVGKTRLAVEVARRLEAAFTDGVYYLPMAGIELPESIVTELASALGLSFSGPADPKLQVIQALRKQNALLVFDNMEHLIEGSAVLGDILQQAPGLRILLTSREPIHLQWEWIFEVQGLPVPEAARPGMFEANSAPALFMQRMRQAGPQRHASSDDENAILNICRLVDGLPLAIELAASWARVMSPGEIAGELANGLDLLETRLQDVPVRHRSIRLVFDHSWKLLSVEEQTALMVLAVFPGGFTREAGQKVANASVRLLSALVSKSLLRYVKQTGRYDFHELIRQYALQRLRENPEMEQSAQARLAEFFAGWLAALEMPIKSAQQSVISAQVQAETANWAAAWRWAARQGRYDLLRLMEFCLYWHFEIHGDNAEAVSSMDYAVSELRRAGAPQALSDDFQKGTFALLVDQAGWFDFRTGNIARASALFAESLEITQGMRLPDHEALYYIYVNWGYMALVTGNFEQSARLTQTSLEHARVLGRKWHQAIAINILGIIEYQLGHLEEADRQLTGSLQLWREVGDLRGLVFCLLYLSSAVLAWGDYERVEAILAESNAIARQKGDRWAHAFGLDLLGHVALARGEGERAIESFRQSLALSHEIRDQWTATLTMIHLGDALLASGDRKQAMSLFHEVYQTARQARWLSTILEVLVTQLSADEEIPPITRLAILEAAILHPAASLPTRQRAEHLRDRLAAMLKLQNDDARSVQLQKSVEEWAAFVFERASTGSRPQDGPVLGWSPAVTPV